MSGADDTRPVPPRPDDADKGGDSACWLERVCDACGALPDGPPKPVCDRCGSATPAGPPA